MSTLRKAIEVLLIGGATAHEVSDSLGADLSYVQSLRRGLVHEGKVPKGKGRGRPKKEVVR